MQILAKLLLVLAVAHLAACAGVNSDRRFERTPAANKSMNVVSACEGAIYRPTGADEQAALACADVLEAWR